MVSFHLPWWMGMGEGLSTTSSNTSAPMNTNGSSALVSLWQVGDSKEQNSSCQGKQEMVKTGAIWSWTHHRILRNHDCCQQSMAGLITEEGQNIQGHLPLRMESAQPNACGSSGDSGHKVQGRVNENRTGSWRHISYTLHHHRFYNQQCQLWYDKQQWKLLEWFWKMVNAVDITTIVGWPHTRGLINYTWA